MPTIKLKLSLRASRQSDW